MCWNAKYIFLIVFTTVVSYSAARLLEHANTKKKGILAGAVILCLGVLFFFKYFNFVSESVFAVLKLIAIPIHPVTVNLLLPVGISFYTFQTLSYVIDVYRGNVPAEHHLGYYAAFISFFPQLVAGPIERTKNLLPQIRSCKKLQFDYDQATYGLKLMAWGYFKKVAIADNLSPYVSTVFNSPHSYSGFLLLLATLFFSIQIYCDFSGYSDIAIGTAKLLGIHLMTNFKSPYFSQSMISDPDLGWITIDHNPKLLQILKPEDYWTMLKRYPRSAAFSAFLWLTGTGNVDEGGCYSRNAFNEYGDVVFKPDEEKLDTDAIFSRYSSGGSRN